MSTPPSPLLLLSGAGLGAWAWDDLRAALGPGREVRVASYPRGTGADLRAYAEHVLAEAPWRRFTLVAHSIGGTIAAEIAAQAPSRVDAVLGVCAVVPPPGRSFAGALPVPQRFVLPPMLRVLGTRPPAKVLREGLAAGLPADLAERVVTDFEPEGRGLYVRRTGTPTWPAHRGYVTTSADGETPPGLQAGFARTLGATWHGELPTGHLPMLQDPAGLAAAIEAFAAAAPGA